MYKLTTNQPTTTQNSSHSLNPKPIYSDAIRKALAAMSRRSQDGYSERILRLLGSTKGR